MFEERLHELGYELPEAATPSFIYVPVVVHNGVAYVSGQLPKVDGEVKLTGKVGGNVSLEEAQESARICILQGLSCLKQELGSLDRIDRFLKVTGFVNSAEGFNQQPKVIDAASDLIEKIFGEKGRHARSAVGAAELPRSTPVEIEMMVAIKMD
ncbi:RidA family protein [Schinkia azotoformans]|uniref:Endoribonuclease L-PSP n=1 Tax=Schinkia azotoformans LMG 9581 TaxID=1131731 RepID=K6D589_SCHAZ|nr:RidA family protein [Schinkia azotoformans]EKN63454.1 endoribonuclease L-PSP [Schinkia azotoformans LMG 9581]MEC1638753.1 RidA family protein [Schinkia azotoformans]MEC1946718.1 RidA family protein [Schinkia azotoformans]